VHAGEEDHARPEWTTARRYCKPHFTFRISRFRFLPTAVGGSDQNGPEFTEQKLTFKHALSLQQ